MYRRLSAVMFPVLAIVLVGALVWGYQENQEKNSILIKAENQYQRAFHDLSYHIDLLHDELGNALAVNAASHTFHRKCLLNAWRITNEAQSEISQLPLTLMPFHETNQFLANMANFSYRTAIEDYGQKPLSREQIDTMKALYERADEIAKELRSVQAVVLGNNLRWMDVELAMASEDENLDNQIIDGFRTVDQKVTGFSEISWDPSMKAASREDQFQELSGPLATPEEVKNKAIQFFNIQNKDQIAVAENGKNTKMHTYSVTIPNETGGYLNIDYTAKGGHMIWFLNSRETGRQTINLLEAQAKAKQFAKQHDFGEFGVINHDQYGGTAAITLAEVQDDVIVFPKKITVNVALDNGEIVGLQATDFVFENKPRDISMPSISIEEAKQSLNPDFEVLSHALALIENDQQEEVVCYAFTGKINGGMYRLFINGNNGQEEKMERLNTIEVNASMNAENTNRK